MGVLSVCVERILRNKTDPKESWVWKIHLNKFKNNLSKNFNWKLVAMWCALCWFMILDSLIMYTKDSIWELLVLYHLKTHISAFKPPWHF